MSDPATKQLREIWRDSWVCADRRDPHIWLEENVEAIPYSPVPGRFRADYSPWIKEPLKEFTNDRTSLISIIAAIQSGKTSTLELGSCWAIANAPAPMLWLDQIDADAKDQCVNRLQPLWENVPPVAKVLPHRSVRKNDGFTFKNGMPFWIKGGNSKTNLQRRSIRWLIADETWRLPAGHMAEAEARVTAFGWLGKRVFSSQFGEENDDTHNKFLETDQREWHVACVHCSKLQPYDWSQVRYDNGCKNEDGSWDFEAVAKSTTYECAHCERQIVDSDQNRRIMSDDARGACFIPQNPSAATGKVGFHWNGLVATGWGSLVEMFLRSKDEARKGDLENLKVFYQKRLAVAFEEFTSDFKLDIEASGYLPTDEWDQEGGIGRGGKVALRSELIEQQRSANATEVANAEKEERPPRSIKVDHGPLRMMTVDVQKGYFYALIRSWSPDGSSRLLHWQKAGTYEELLRLGAEWKVQKRLTFVDAGYDAWGKNSKNAFGVYAACAKHGFTALMGHRQERFRHQVQIRKGGKLQTSGVDRFYSPKRTVSVGTGNCSCFYFSNLNCKDLLAHLRGNQDHDEGATWEVHSEVDDEYLRQMESEVRVFERGSWRWVPIGTHTANHLWDCEVMQVVGALMLRLVGKESVDEGESSE